MTDVRNKKINHVGQIATQHWQEQTDRSRQAAGYSVSQVFTLFFLIMDAH